jgi:hypothetical protein
MHWRLNSYPRIESHANIRPFVSIVDLSTDKSEMKTFRIADKKTAMDQLAHIPASSHFQNE